MDTSDDERIYVRYMRVHNRLSIVFLALVVFSLISTALVMQTC